MQLSTNFTILFIIMASIGHAQLEQLKIAPPPDGGMYIGQYEWQPGHVDTFEQAIERPTAWFGRNSPLEIIDGHPHFHPSEAENNWENGKISIVSAYEATPNPDENELPGFTVDKLLMGIYDANLKELADSFKVFGKPMFFLTAREPLGIGFYYQGGFGPDGEESIYWAIENNAGLADFDPSIFPNAQLYEGLGDPLVSDGIERLVAAHRYYHHFFVEQEGLEFLTFETWGYPAGTDDNTMADNVNELADEYPGADIDHIDLLVRSSLDFENYYPGDEYVDWVSINFYTLDYYAEDWTGLDEDFLVPTSYWLQLLENTLNIINEVAVDKPIYFLEFGMPDGRKIDSEYAASKVEEVFEYLIQNGDEYNIHGFSMWSYHPFWMLPDNFPFDCLIRPGTAQGEKLKEIMDDNPASFHSCVFLSDGNLIPPCATISSSLEQASTHEIKVFPNPFNSTTTITVEHEENPTYLILFDGLNRKVGKYHFNGQNSLQINRASLSSGMYYFMVYDENKNLGVERLIVE